MLSYCICLLFFITTGGDPRLYCEVTHFGSVIKHVATQCLDEGKVFKNVQKGLDQCEYSARGPKRMKGKKSEGIVFDLMCILLQVLKNSRPSFWSSRPPRDF
jgi:hypothetical protein